ncbi:MAG: STAS domain-containing protein [Solirubrobacterales bacterium]|nr:STAS domain-containing protein [Solirubrobacterales bacterium]
MRTNLAPMSSLEHLDVPQLASFMIRSVPDRDRRTRVVVEGELDLLTSPSLAGALDRGLSTAEELLLDLSGVQFIDSAGLQAILGALQACRSNGCALLISSELPAQALRLFEITGVLGQLPLVDVR